MKDLAICFAGAFVIYSIVFCATWYTSMVFYPGEPKKAFRETVRALIGV